MYPHAHGHLIGGHHITENGTGFRTIMAYYFPGHRTRVNYWSNPKIKFPVTGTPMGIVNVANNARVLTENRFTVASYGDESGSCASSNNIKKGNIGKQSY